jgi:hypothetical protein
MLRSVRHLALHRDSREILDDVPEEKEEMGRLAVV